MIFALSLNLLLGYAGQVSVAHAAFGAIGGYTVGYLTLNEGWNFLPAVLVGVGFAGIVGLLVSLPAMKLVTGVPHPAHAGRVVGDPRARSRRSPSSAARTA